MKRDMLILAVPHDSITKHDQLVRLLNSNGYSSKVWKFGYYAATASLTIQGAGVKTNINLIAQRCFNLKKGVMSWQPSNNPLINLRELRGILTDDHDYVFFTSN